MIDRYSGRSTGAYCRAEHVVIFSGTRSTTECLSQCIELVEIKYLEYDLTLYTVNAEFETTLPSFSKIVTNTCFHHMYTIDTSRTTWKHSHMYRVNRCCPRRHMLFTHWSKNALWRNLKGESKRVCHRRILSSHLIAKQIVCQLAHVKVNLLGNG